MNASTISILIAFVCYLTAMIFIGFGYYKKTSSSSDFFLGGRRVGPWMTALSAEASDMSGWLLMGLPGVAYMTGMKEAFWTALGLVIGTYLNWLIVAKRLRKYTLHSGNSITIPEFFTNRFRDKSRVISLVSVIFILIFFTIYTASGFVACAKLFNSVFGIPYIYSLLLGIGVILIYTLLGGYLAVCATDFVQGSLMFVALLITPIVAIIFLGGPVETFSRISEFGAEFLNPFISGPTDNFGIAAIISALAWGLGYFGMPHILVRFMSIRSNDEVKLSRRIAMVWVVIAFIGALL
ncbi:MAG: sodium/proline symporter, partial [Spirochaetaceae bacterium]|nr:sodium/proline symporter [Spirochaetaceae bacterium]